MSGLNKMIGGLLGFLLAGPGGCLFGILIGHVFDQHLTTSSDNHFWEDIWMKVTHRLDSASDIEDKLISASELQKAYHLLGLREDVDFSEVKQAYRRAMNRYHPDRLAKQNLSPQQMKKARQQLQYIKDAYELITKAEDTLT